LEHLFYFSGGMEVYGEVGGCNGKLTGIEGFFLLHMGSK
jgi:hypothetical protein